MTSPIPARTNRDWQTNDNIPPEGNEQVARMMAEHGIGRRRAYRLLKLARAAQIDTGEVPEHQRSKVLAALVEDPAAGHNGHTLIDALHRRGVPCDMHDVVKTIWSLQKATPPHVHFREQHTGELYAIKVTDAGLAAYAGIKERLATARAEQAEQKAQLEAEAMVRRNGEAHDVEILPEVLPEPFVEQAAADAELDEAEQTQGAYTAKLSEVLSTPPPLEIEPDVRTGEIARPWFKGNLGGWPSIRAVRDRAVKAEKINQAAKLLEEAGEDETALALMGKTEFTPLELEVIELLKAFEEL